MKDKVHIKDGGSFMKAEEKEELKSSFKSQSKSKREPLFKSKTLQVVRE